MAKSKRTLYAEEVDKLLKRLSSSTECEKANAVLIREDAISLAKSALTNSASQITRLEKVTFVPRDYKESPEDALKNGITYLEIRLKNLRFEIGLELSPELQKPESLTFRWLINHLGLKQWATGILLIVTIFYLGIALSETGIGQWIKQFSPLNRLLG